MNSLNKSEFELARTRHHDVSNEGAAYEYSTGKKTKVIHKTVQCWIYVRKNRLYNSVGKCSRIQC
jgi:hypothetical protein